MLISLSSTHWDHRTLFRCPLTPAHVLESASRQKAEATVGASQLLFPSFLGDYDAELSVVQNLKTLLSSILSGILVVFKRRLSPVFVTLSRPEAKDSGGDVWTGTEWSEQISHLKSWRRASQAEGTARTQATSDEQQGVRERETGDEVRQHGKG